MKFSKIFTAVIFFMLLFIPANIYAAANDTVTLEYEDNKKFDPLFTDASTSRKKVYLKVRTQSQLNIGKNTIDDKILSWKSSKNRVVSIHKKTGKIKALRGGASLITAKTKNGHTVEYLVIVYERLVNVPEADPNTPFIVSHS